RGRVEGLVAARHREAYLDPTHRELRSATLERLESLDPVIAVLVAEAGNTGGRHLSKQGIELVVGVEDGEAFFRQRRHQLALGARELFARVEELDVHYADVRDDPDHGFREAGQAPDVPRTLHAHLQDERGMVGL